MKGKLISIEKLAENLYEMNVQLIDEGILVRVTVNRNYQYLIGKDIVFVTNVLEISNSNFGHIYPEGTIGTF